MSSSLCNLIPYRYEPHVQTDPIERKRAKFRARFNNVLFNSQLNALLVTLIIIGCLIFSASNIQWNTRLLLLLPVGFLYSDAAMYLAHRYQQHRKLKFQEAVFEMHSIWHHGMFTNNKMHVDSVRDMNMVILPFFVHGFVLCGIYLPIAFLVNLLHSDFGWILLFSVALHSMWYEIVHTIAHMKNPPILKALARHHREHHNPKSMGKYNFGIATTLFDRIFGTRIK